MIEEPATMGDSTPPTQSETTKSSFRWLSVELAFSLFVWLLTVVWVAAVVKTEVSAQGVQIDFHSNTLRQLSDADATLRQQSAVVTAQVVEHERRLRDLESLNRQLLDTISRMDENIKFIKTQLATKP